MRTSSPIFSVIIWESLVEGAGKSLGTVWSIWVGSWSGSSLDWLSLDHHGDGDVIVVGGVLGLGSVLLSDGLEGIVTNNLSERLEGNGVNAIKGVGWGTLRARALFSSIGTETSWEWEARISASVNSAPLREAGALER